MPESFNIEEGFGESSMADLVELRKALEIGTSQPVTGTGFDALRVESLEATLKLLTYSAEHVKLWNMIPKLEAFSTVEEYNRLVEYGTEAGGFVASGELPEEEDTTYERADQKVKYIGSTRSVHHPATLVRTVPADLISQETQNGALWIMKKANRGLYYADSAVIPLEWNGLQSQLLSGAGNVIDAAGAGLSESDVENAAQLVIDNYGTPTQLFSNPKVFVDFGKTYQSFQRWAQPGGRAGVAGTPTTGFNTLSGLINFQADTFVLRGTRPTAAASSPKSPPAPTLTLGTPGANPLSKFLAGDAGNYRYEVTAINRFGESAPSVETATVNISAGEDHALVITDSGGTYPATGYKIYRTPVGGTTATATWINLAIARAQSGGVYTSPTTFTDLNEWRESTFMALLLDMTSQSLSFKQLSPMIKMPLATISPAIRWMQLLYGTPILYAPKKNVLIKNIGSL